MRRHTIRTTKILAIVAVASGCNPTARTLPPATSATRDAPSVSTDGPAPAAATVPADGAAADAGLAVALAADGDGGATATTPVGSPASPSDDSVATVSVAPAANGDGVTEPLEWLRRELANSTKEAAFARLPHFRPLCDDKGFPVVGNVIRKSPTYTVSAFCEDLRRERPPEGSS